MTRTPTAAAYELGWRDHEAGIHRPEAAIAPDPAPLGCSECGRPEADHRDGFCPAPTEPTTAAGKRFCEGPRPTGNWWKGVPDQIAAIEAEARAEAEMEYADCWQEGDRLRARLALMEAVVGKVPLLLSVISSGEHLSQREYNEVRAALAAIEGSKP